MMRIFGIEASSPCNEPRDDVQMTEPRTDVQARGALVLAWWLSVVEKPAVMHVRQCAEEGQRDVGGVSPSEKAVHAVRAPIAQRGEELSDLCGPGLSRRA